MRHLFDQYDGTENRVTHTLACCLAEDPKLLARFIEWSTGRKPPAPARLHVREQQLPGDPPLWKEVAKRRGLPDICIHDGDAWCFLIENKLGAALTASQLRRHRSTILRRGFESVEVLAICPTESASSTVDGAHQRRWTQVYEWSRGLTRTSRWVGCLADYLEVVEMRLDEEGRERGWSLTTFTGIPFSSEIPYEYRQAKRLLKLAMEALRQCQDLREQLGIAHDGGRGKITGREADGVWDTLRLSRAPAEKQMQSLPHLTLAIGQQHVLAILVLPNGLKTEFRRRLRDLGLGGFLDLLREVTRGMSSAPLRCPWLGALGAGGAAALPVTEWERDRGCRAYTRSAHGLRRWGSPGPPRRQASAALGADRLRGIRESAWHEHPASSGREISLRPLPGHGKTRSVGLCRSCLDLLPPGNRSPFRGMSRPPPTSWLAPEVRQSTRVCGPLARSQSRDAVVRWAQPVPKALSGRSHGRSIRRAARPWGSLPPKPGPGSDNTGYWTQERGGEDEATRQNPPSRATGSALHFERPALLHRQLERALDVHRHLVAGLLPSRAVGRRPGRRPLGMGGAPLGDAAALRPMAVQGAPRAAGQPECKILSRARLAPGRGHPHPRRVSGIPGRKVLAMPSHRRHRPLDGCAM